MGKEIRQCRQRIKTVMQLERIDPTWKDTRINLEWDLLHLLKRQEFLKKSSRVDRVLIYLHLK
jgi:hypothetical protein